MSVDAARDAVKQALRVSVVVSTHGRAGLAARLVTALERQTLSRDEFEVVVVDDGSWDGTAAVVSEVAARSPLDVRIVRRAFNGGPAAGRNTGWQVARSPVIAFTDDDCVPADDWLAQGLAAMGDDVAVVAGRTVPAPEQADRLGRPWTRTVRADEARFFQCCNVFYRRDVLDAVGGFDVTFRTGEDTELSLRAQAQGAGTAFAETSLVFHDVRDGQFRDALREAVRWTDLPGVIARHPDARRFLHHRVFWKRSHPVAVLAALGLVAARRRRVALMLLVPWVVHRTVEAPVCAGRRRRWLTLPQAFAVDLLEVATMLRGSLRHRALVL